MTVVLNAARRSRAKPVGKYNDQTRPPACASTGGKPPESIEIRSLRFALHYPAMGVELPEQPFFNRVVTGCGQNIPERVQCAKNTHADAEGLAESWAAAQCIYKQAGMILKRRANSAGAAI